MLLVRDDVSLATGSAGDLSQPRRTLPTRGGGRSAFLSGMLRMQVQGCLWPKVPASKDSQARTKPAEKTRGKEEEKP